LQAQVLRLGLQDHVELLGFCDNPYALLRQADLFLMSSDHEGLPNALIEAQGMGLPAVSTDCPHGPREIIRDQQTGLLVPTGNASAMADAILTVTNSPQRQSQMGAAAKQATRERFSADALTEQWQQCLARQTRVQTTKQRPPAKGKKSCVA
jgi:glycosyltransferase involved in cell wall biosynthesis